jgi:Tol biopolymer transport system component
VSDNGVLVYLPSAGGDAQQLSWLDSTGKTTGVIDVADRYFSPRLSSDDTRLAVARIDAKTRAGDIYAIELARGTSVRLTFDPGDDHSPVWSPDGRYVLWGSSRAGKHQLFRKLASGAGPEELLWESSHPVSADDWSPDGRFIIYRETDPKTKNDLWILPLDGGTKPYPLMQTEADEQRARFSNDGSFIGYHSNEFGTPETYVQTFPVSGSRWQVSTTGGSAPEWRKDGKELYYSGAGKMWAVEVKSTTPFQLGARRALFDLPSIPLRSFWSVTGDGQRFVFAINQEPDRRARFYTVVLNWAAAIENLTIRR